VLYRIFDAVLASDWPLPELPPAAPGDACAAIAVEPAAAPVDDRDVAWFHEWRLADEEPWLVARLPAGGYLVRVPDLADFLIEAAETRVRFVRRPNATDDTLRHVLVDFILPLVMTHRGELVLHASGAALPGGAVLLIARSGLGKSTIAAALAARGARIVADDAIALREEGDGLVAIGAYAGLRLWPDILERAHPDKRRIHPGNSALPFAEAPVRVACLYVLEPSPTGPIRIDPLPPREAVVALVSNAYVLDCGDRDRLERQLDRVVRCARAVPVRRLVFPHDASRLDELSLLLLHDQRQFA
jgi:hypothetical protein